VEGATLADSTITLKLDERSGAIASLRARGMEHEFVNEAANIGLNGYVYLPGGNVQDAQGNGPAKISVKENGPLVASLLVKSDAPGCKKLLREIRLVDGLDRVEISDTIERRRCGQSRAFTSVLVSMCPAPRCASTFHGGNPTREGSA